MATEGNSPSISEEYSLPPKEVSVKSSADEKSSVSTATEPNREEDADTPPADDTAAAVETSETTEEEESAELPELPEAEDSPTAVDSEAAEETADQKPKIRIETAPADFRFPTTNQTRHCFTRYIEYHRCVAAKGEGAPECEKFSKYYV